MLPDVDSLAAGIPDWLVAQTAVDVEELIRALDALGKRGELRALAPLRRACRKLSQDARYMREFKGGIVRRAGARSAKE